MEKLLLKILFQKVFCVEGYSDKMNILVLWSCIDFKLLLMQLTFEVEKEKLIVLLQRKLCVYIPMIILCMYMVFIFRM